MQDKMGAILAADYPAYAWRFTGSADASNNYQVAKRSWTTNNFNMAPPPATDIVEPATGFTAQVYTGVDVLTQIATGFDRSPIDNTQIFIIGNGEAPVSDQDVFLDGTVDPNGIKSSMDCDPRPRMAETQAQAYSRSKLCVGTKKTWFIYKASNDRTYAARSVPLIAAGNDPNAEPLRTDTGVRMLQMLRTLDKRLADAQALPFNDPNRDRRVAVTQTAFDKYVSNIEVMRSLHKAFGYGPFKTDAPFVY